MYTYDALPFGSCVEASGLFFAPKGVGHARRTQVINPDNL
jgi:hypothetical protein